MEQQRDQAARMSGLIPVVHPSVQNSKSGGILGYEGRIGYSAEDGTHGRTQCRDGIEKLLGQLDDQPIKCTAAASEFGAKIDGIAVTLH